MERKKKKGREEHENKMIKRNERDLSIQSQRKLAQCGTFEFVARRHHCRRHSSTIQLTAVKTFRIVHSYYGIRNLESFKWQME